MTTETLTSGSSWVAPAGVTSVTVECWGGGGGGGGTSQASADGGGGGGGGAYAKLNTYSVTPGNSYSYQIGGAGSGGINTTAATAGGDTWFVSSGTVMAKGGGAGGKTSNAALHLMQQRDQIAAA